MALTVFGLETLISKGNAFSAATRTSSMRTASETEIHFGQGLCRYRAQMAWPIQCHPPSDANVRSTNLSRSCENQPSPMSSRRYAFCFALILTLTTACRGKHERAAVQNEEPAQAGAQLQSAIKTADPATAPQLLSGFYDVEGNAWRWAQKSFTVLLHPPATASAKGATLNFAFTIPDVVHEKLGAVTVTATVAGAKLGSQKFEKSGAQTFTADVPASLCGGDALTIEFTLDKAMPPGPVDKRELGVVANSFSLESK
jgi:hypothetical protein